MFYCTPCARKHKYPTTPQTQSLSKCEICGAIEVCNDMESSYLPESPIFKKQREEKMSKQRKSKRVRKAAKLLIAASEKTTTLEIKNYLRAKYPDENWTQDYVSSEMIKFSTETPTLKNLDNGVYKTYYLEALKPTSKTKKLKKAPAKPVKVSLTKMCQLIENSKGRFFTVIFNKKTNGEHREMNGQVRKDNLRTDLGHFKITERVGRKSQQRQVDPHTIKGLRISGVTYQVK